MKPFNKSSIPQLDMAEASRILEQTFEAAQSDPNTVPFDVLAANCLYHRRKRFWQKIAMAAAIVSFILIAFLFALSIPSSFTIQNQMAEDAFNPVYEIHVDSFMLVDRVSAAIDGRSIPVYETDSHVYSVEPSLNGQMEVTVTLLNRKSATQYIEVAAVDREEPIATGCSREGNLVYLYLSDGFSGIDYDSIQATTLAGGKVAPVSVDPSTGCVAFSHLEETVNVYVSDLAGNQLHLILSIS